MSYAIITYIALLLSVGAALVGTVMYIMACYTRRTYILTIGIINFFVSFLMLLIMVLTIASLATAGSVSGDPFEVPWARAGLVSIIVFISGQVIYLLVSSSPFNSPMRQLLHHWGLLPATKETHEQEKEIEAKYLASLCKDPQLTALQIIDMSAPLNLIDVYVDVKLYKAYTSREPSQGKMPDSRWLQGGEKKEDGKGYDPAELIYDDDYRHSVILGDLGIGKTTSLRRLTLRLAEEMGSTTQTAKKKLLPIYIELNAFASHRKTDLLEFIVTTISSKYTLDVDELLKWLKKKLNNGDVLLLLDALDETLIGKSIRNAEDAHFAIQKMISKFARTYKFAHIFVTSRKISGDKNRRSELRDHDGPFHTFELRGFTCQEDINQFIRKWFKKRTYLPENVSVDDLIFQLENDKRLQSFTANPLLLSLVAMVYERGLGLPDRRSVLYERCVDILLGRGNSLSKWDSSKGVLRQNYFSAATKQRLLEEIAWHFQETSLSGVSNAEMQALIVEFLEREGDDSRPKRAQLCLSEIIEAHGLLKVEKYVEEKKENVYRFLHSAFQAYFAAYDAINEERLDNLLKHRWEDNWKEVIVLYSTYVPNVHPLWQRLEKGDDVFLTNQILVGHCIAVYPKRWHDFSAKVRDYLYHGLVEIPCSFVRDRIAETLVEIGSNEIGSDEIGSETIIAYLLEKFVEQGGDRAVRRSIINAFKEFGRRSLKEYKDQLMEWLSDPEVDLFIREEIADVLVDLRDQALASDLLRLLFNPATERTLHPHLVGVLRYLEEPDLLPRLKERMSDSKIHEQARESIAEILGKQGELSLLKELFPLLHNKKIPYPIRHSFVLALAQRTKEKDAIVEMLRPLSIDGQLEVPLRADCLIALYALDEHSVAPDLLNMIADEKNIRGDVRCGFVSSLGELRISLPAPGLIDLLLSLNAKTDKANLSVYVEIIRFIGSSVHDRAFVHKLLLDLLFNEEFRRHDLLLKTIAEELASDGGYRNLSEEIKDSLRSITSSFISDESKLKESEFQRGLVIALGILGDMSTLDKLVQYLLNAKITPDERERIENALIDFDNYAIVVERLKKELLHSRYMLYSENIRRSILTVIKSRAADAETCWLLVGLLSMPVLREEIYDALWEVSHRAKYRICKVMTDDGVPYYDIKAYSDV